MKKSIKASGVFKFEHIRDGQVIDTWESKNLVVNEGLDYLLDAGLSAGTPQVNWFVGLYEGVFTPLATTDASSISTDSTETLVYTPATRPSWVEPGVVTQQITNSASPSVFTFTADKVVRGAFLISSATKSGTSGILLSASNFSSSRSMLTSDILNVSYTITAQAV